MRYSEGPATGSSERPSGRAGGGDVRPPIESAGVPRPTVRRRRTVRAVVWEDERVGDLPLSFSAHDPYVRRFWTAVIGPGAVADLLRLMAAASHGRTLVRPIHLSDLARAGLASGYGDVVAVRAVIPPVPPEWVRRFPVPLREAHAQALRL